MSTIEPSPIRVTISSTTGERDEEPLPGPDRLPEAIRDLCIETHASEDAMNKGLELRPIDVVQAIRSADIDVSKQEHRIVSSASDPTVDGPPGDTDILH